MSYLTFPGIVVHEFAHAWACRRLGIRVHKVCYLRFGNPMGYVLHEQPEFAIQHVMVAVAPFFISTIVSLSFSLAGCLLTRSQFVSETRDMLTLVTLWIGFSCALHAFPSSGDADSLWEELRNHRVSLFAKIILAPVVWLIRLGQLGARFWLDALFAMVIVATPPVLLLVAIG